MKIPHTVTHYVLAAALAGGLYATHEEKPKIEMVPTAEVHEVTHVRVGAHDWPPLTEKQTIDLGELLDKLNPNQDKHVTLLCGSTACQNLRESIHEAFTIGWYGDDYEDVFVESEHDHGIFVGPPGKEADAVATAIHKITGYKVYLVGLSDIEGSVGVIFGKYDGK